MRRGLVCKRTAEDHGIVGDLHTVALIGKNGSVDFLCLPSFDSPSVFAALLDADRGGRFQIAPRLDDAVHRQLYLPDTNVLLTRFLSESGVAEVSDFMPVEDAGVAHNLVRPVVTPATERGGFRRSLWTEYCFYGNMGNMKTTLELPDTLMRRVKLRAVHRNQKLKDAIAQLLELGLAAAEDESKPLRMPKPLRLKDRRPLTIVDIESAIGTGRE